MGAGGASASGAMTPRSSLYAALASPDCGNFSLGRRGLGEGFCSGSGFGAEFGLGP